MQATRKIRVCLAGGLGLIISLRVCWANPLGLTVQSGAATAVETGTHLNITTSQNAALNWQSFNISPGETTTFVQPSASSFVLNRIADQNPSQIWGNLNANGTVILVNQAGFYFGPNSLVRAANFVASTASVAPLNLGVGSAWQFTGSPVAASIINYGRIEVGHGGSAFLIAQKIENHGDIFAPAGNIGLISGNDVLLSCRPDGLGLSAQVKLPRGSIDNEGRIVANAGTIVLNAQVVNQNGLLQANSVRNQNGVIELFATETVELGSGSRIVATGGNGNGAGGVIQIKSDGTFADDGLSKISVAGGKTGGNGGAVEISAVSLPAIHSVIDGHSVAGFTGGQLTIDPTDIILSATGTGSIGNGTVLSTASTGALNLNVNSAFIGFSQIDLQASHDITLAAYTTWDLSQSTGSTAASGKLTLEAGNNINIQDGASLLAGAGWSVILDAGRNFASSGMVTAGTGSITLAGTGSIQAQDGNVTLLAGENVTVNGGFIRTMNGGNISVTALAGSINTGTLANGFDFRPAGTGYVVDPNLGGISTANGGNVALTAGLDIISYLPVNGGIQSDAGSGAFGSAPGNVIIKAGRNVAGHFVAVDGVGTISAGNDAGIPTEQLALSLVNGGWNVTAVNDILLQEIRNPNGIFNDLGFGSSTTKHYFDYSASAFASLTAGNSVQLLGGALPRNDDNFEQSIPTIYPGELTIHAGAGGVVLGNDVILFPSPLGNLTITTVNGGSLTGTKPGDLTELILSDSGKKQYRSTGDFGINDHAAVPIYLTAETISPYPFTSHDSPVLLKIAGDMDSIVLGVAKEATITIGGDMINSRFQGQNLHPGDVTSINVAGDILNRNEFTSVTVDQAPNFSVFYSVYPPLPALIANLPGQFSYNATTKTLTFEGRMTSTQLQELLNLQVPVYNQYGQPLYDAQGNPVTQLAQFTTPAALQTLFANSQDIPLNPDTGYFIGGGGQFNLTARNLDLGATGGIVSEGPKANPALANYFTGGADIHVTLSGNLDMFSTTISSLNGGSVSVSAGGYINVGSTYFQGDDSVARGIFTVDASAVTVIASGDININGSRIAAYDGGDITIRSLTGNVDAGNGGAGSVPVEEIFVDPITRAIETFTPTFPGSGILATTFPHASGITFPASQNTVGNILVETPQGSISANVGGITQLPFNGVNVRSGSVTLNAGSTDTAGNVLYVGNIEASDSGIIGSTVNLHATGSINASLVARNNINVNGLQNVNLFAIAPGLVTVASGGTISGTLIGLDGITATGSEVSATLLSQNVTTSGLVDSSQIGFNAGTAANSASGSLQAGEIKNQLANSLGQTNGDYDIPAGVLDARPQLIKTSGRVTVVPIKK